MGWFERRKEQNKYNCIIISKIIKVQKFERKIFCHLAGWIFIFIGMLIHDYNSKQKVIRQQNKFNSLK